MRPASSKSSHWRVSDRRTATNTILTSHHTAMFPHPNLEQVITQAVAHSPHQKQPQTVPVVQSRRFIVVVPRLSRGVFVREKQDRPLYRHKTLSEAHITWNHPI